MMMKLYRQSDYNRIKPLVDSEAYRSDFRIDYARVLHSPVFRRLQGKTQLYPSFESDFFRNRLTHSLEVAQIAKSIALKTMSENKETFNLIDGIDLDLVEFAALSHDLGHPPFGHNGEDKLDELMADEGGYEGNAQTLRILTYLEKKERNPLTNHPIGLNVTYRSMASILKYDSVIEKERPDRVKTKKGYYYFDENLVANIKKAVGEIDSGTLGFHTLECSIMDAADDIAYSVYDLEDGLKAGFLSPLDFINPDMDLCEKIANKLDKLKLTKNDVYKHLQSLFKELIDDSANEGMKVAKNKGLNDEAIMFNFFATVYSYSKNLESNGYYRTAYTSRLINTFMNGLLFDQNLTSPALSQVFFDEKTAAVVNILKTFNYIKIIESSRLKIAEHRGKEIVEKIFKALEQNYRLMPTDHIEMYERTLPDCSKRRVITDFIAGMTDHYALKFYCRLFSENPESIFKPL